MTAVARSKSRRSAQSAQDDGKASRCLQIIHTFGKRDVVVVVPLVMVVVRLVVVVVTVVVVVVVELEVVWWWR